jgi:hypothetical protein
MADLVASDKQTRFGAAKRDSLPQYCLDCEVRFACHGGCPKNRFTTTPDGEPGLNYLCLSYKQFFAHIRPAMDAMTTLLQQGRAPAEVMPGGRSPQLLGTTEDDSATACAAYSAIELATVPTAFARGQLTDCGRTLGSAIVRREPRGSCIDGAYDGEGYILWLSA